MNFDVRTLGSRFAATALALGLIGASATAEATSGRVWTLGNRNRFIQDDANRWIYPHTITKYGNLFYLELYGLANSFGSMPFLWLRSVAGSPVKTSDVVDGSTRGRANVGNGIGMISTFSRGQKRAKPSTARRKRLRMKRTPMERGAPPSTVSAVGISSPVKTSYQLTE